MNINGEDTRQARRAEKLRKKKARVKKHGKNIGNIYLNAIKKRLKRRS